MAGLSLLRYGGSPKSESESTTLTVVRLLHILLQPTYSFTKQKYGIH